MHTEHSIDYRSGCCTTCSAPVLAIVSVMLDRGEVVHVRLDGRCQAFIVLMVLPDDTLWTIDTDDGSELTAIVREVDEIGLGA